MDDTKPKDQQLEEQAGVGQAAIDAAAAAISGEKPEETVNAVRVEEHPISDDEAKKYVGVGDFALPTKTAPLDDLIGTQQPSAPAAGDDVPQPSTTKPALDKLTAPQAGPMPLPKVDAKDLEKKAQEMLKALDGAEKKKDQSDESPSPKPKRRGSGTAVRMALAAVLVVMMGAGGIVGMNLLKMQQSAENRSKAEGCPRGYEQCTPGGKRCQQDSAGNNTGYNCTCIDLTTTGCSPSPYTVWNCTEWNPSACPTSNEHPPAGAFDCPITNGGNCTNQAGTYYWYECEGMHLPTSRGCQDRLVDGPKNQLSGCFLPPSSGFCGVQQMDVKYGDGKMCFMSREVPCAPPTENDNPLSCTGLTSSKTSPAIGDTVTFTCASSGEGLDHYEFRYNISGGAWQMLLASSTSDGGATTSNTARVIISQPGTYTVQCRACKDAQGNNCTSWGLAQ